MAHSVAEKGTQTGLSVLSIGACLAQPTEKKKSPYIAVAYKYGHGALDVGFLFMDLPPKNKVYDREDFLQAIKQAEGVKSVTYVNTDGKQKDICICRHDVGLNQDFVERKDRDNSFIDGFSEVMASSLRFEVSDMNNLAIKPLRKLDIKVSFAFESSYEKDSYEYAVINAFNACLLSKLFEREELQMETKDHKRVKIEVRNTVSSFIDGGTLFIKPIFRESNVLVDYYVTEEFNFIDGEDVFTRTYKISYSNRLNEYTITRL